MWQYRELKHKGKSRVLLIKKKIHMDQSEKKWARLLHWRLKLTAEIKEKKITNWEIHSVHEYELSIVRYQFCPNQPIDTMPSQLKIPAGFYCCEK